MADLVVGARCTSGDVQGSIARSGVAGLSRVDLGRTNWFTPFGLVSVLAFIDRQRREGNEVEFVAPVNRDRGSYLYRMGMGDRLDELGVVHRLPFVPARRNSGLVELHSFDSVSSMSGLAEHIHDAVAPLDAVAAGALHRSLSEAGENVEEHSGLSNGFLAAQWTKDWGTTPTLRFAVADAGRGFLGNLAAFGATTDAHALTMALGGTSSAPGRGRRGGLKLLSSHLVGLGGTIVVSSGASKVSQDASSTAVRDFVEPFLGSVFEGTLPLGTGPK
ncbi:hypothetical protein ACO0E1_00855 [Curtobacterium sp. RRHDQ66]|uniref:hypothetical protein n=1 Tax=Curtobacterium guangdongense TaxID=3413380 RepID=UPI003BEFF804